MPSPLPGARAADRPPGAAPDSRSDNAIDGTGDLLRQLPPPGAGGVTAPAEGEAGAAAIALPTTLYRSTAEVDQPAEPLVGWALPLHEFPGLQTLHFKAQVWVSALGRIDRVQLLNGTPLPVDIDRLSDSLQTTPMRAAQLDGRAVASTRVVEFAIELDPVQALP